MQKGIYCILAIFALSLWVGCNNDDDDNAPNPEQQAIDEDLIQGYISTNNLNATSVGDGLYVVIEEEGTGAVPGASDFLAVHYEGFLLDGTKFDSSKDRKAVTVFPLSGVIQGWQRGIPQFKEGGLGQILIPSHLAYGSNPPPGIPANAVLVFEVEIVATGASRDPVQRIADDQSIQEYISANNLSTQMDQDGLYFTVDTEGTGNNPLSDETVTVHYEGFLLNGTKFDSSRDRGTPATFSLTEVIQGWQMGIPLFQEGGRGKLLIPSHLAYGDRSPSNLIPAYSVLVFDVELISVAN
ncbi:MAG: FKBP-type peptidyl-prolyl cis-trans isomerase [Bacteroidota bacterium]